MYIFWSLASESEGSWWTCPEHKEYILTSPYLVVRCLYPLRHVPKPWATTGNKFGFGGRAKILDACEAGVPIDQPDVTVMFPSASLYYVFHSAPWRAHFHRLWCHPAIKSTQKGFFSVGYCSCLDWCWAVSLLPLLLFWIPSLISFRYGAEVENYLEVYLRTPGLSNSDITRALLARGSARKRGGESLLVKAEHGTYHSPPPKFNLFEFFFFFFFFGYRSTDFRTVLKLDPLNKELQQSLRRQTVRGSIL